MTPQRRSYTAAALLLLAILLVFWATPPLINTVSTTMSTLGVIAGFTGVCSALASVYNFAIAIADSLQQSNSSKDNQS